MVSVAIMQPVYIPWLGYFEQIAHADEFMFFDDVQYTKRDWRNRNKIRTSAGWTWLTIPTKGTSRYTPIKSKEVHHDYWKRKNLECVRHNYGRTPYYDEVMPIYEAVISSDKTLLIDYTIPLIQEICRYLNLKIPTLKSSDVEAASTNRLDRILQLCRSVNADTFYTGPAAQNYIDVDYMRENGLNPIFQNYEHPTYKQAFAGFESHMSILDLLMNHGPDSRDILEGKGND